MTSCFVISGQRTKNKEKFSNTFVPSACDILAVSLNLFYIVKNIYSKIMMALPFNLLLLLITF